MRFCTSKLGGVGGFIIRREIGRVGRDFIFGWPELGGVKEGIGNLVWVGVDGGMECMMVVLLIVRFIAGICFVEEDNIPVLSALVSCLISQVTVSNKSFSGLISLIGVVGDEIFLLFGLSIGLVICVVSIFVSRDSCLTVPVRFSALLSGSDFRAKVGFDEL